MAIRMRSPRCEVEDLLQDSYLVMVRACQKFEETMECSFFGFLHRLLRQRLWSRAHHYNSMVHVPHGTRRWYGRLSAKPGGLSDQMTDHCEATEKLGLTRAKAKTLVMLNTAAPHPFNFGTLDLTDDVPGPEPEYKIDEEQEDAGERCRQMLSEVKPNYAEVLTLLFGIGTDEPIGITEIARRFGVSKQRVDQMRDKAVEELRSKTQKAPERPVRRAEAAARRRERGQAVRHLLHTLDPRSAQILTLLLSNSGI